MIDPEIQAYIDRRIEALRLPFSGPSLDPQTLSLVKDATAIPYRTARSTYTPKKNGTMEVVKTGGLYYLRCYVDGAWRESQIT